jgi:hypothetical protein
VFTKEKNIPGVILLKRDQLTIFLKDVNQTSVDLALTNDIVSDLEIKDRKKLAEAIRLFIEKNKIKPANFILILSSDTYFQKDLSVSQSNVEFPTLLQQFVELIPFEKVYSKAYQVNKGTRIITVNEQFYQEILHILTDLDFEIDLILPEINILENLNFKQLDGTVIPKLFDNKDSLKQYSFPVTIEKKPVKIQKIASSKQDDNRRVIILLSIFLSLLIILAIVLYNYFKTSYPTKNPKKSSISIEFFQNDKIHKYF